MDPVILASARRHQIADDDILHAYRNTVRVLRKDDLTMIIGADRTGRLIEVGVVVAESIEFIVHAMHARPKFLRGM